MSILVLTSDTLIGTPATGNLEYNGQFFGTDSNASRAQMQRITQGTAVASTSGTSISYTSIPAWVKRITVIFSGVSTNSTNNIQLQLGSGSIDIASYTGAASSVRSGGTSNIYNNSTGFIICAEVVATAVITGSATVNLLTSNTWVCTGNFTDPTAGRTTVSGGAKALSGTLDQLRIIASSTGNPADTFDAGSINILYEG